MRRALPLLLIFLVPSGAASCIKRETAVNLTPQEKLFAITNATLEKITRVYNEVLPLAGEAYANGILNDEQIAEVQTAGERVDASLTVAEDALARYFRGTASRSDARAALTVALATLPDLLDLLSEFGVAIPKEVEVIARAAIVMIDVTLEEISKEADAVSEEVPSE